MRDAEGRAQVAEARADEIVASSMKLLQIVEQCLREAADHVAAADARASDANAFAEERLPLEERVRQAEARAIGAEARAQIAEDLLDQMRRILERSRPTGAYDARLRKGLH